MAGVGETIRNFVLEHENCNKQPVVFRELHSSWAPLTWSLDKWGSFLSSNLNDDYITARAGLKSHLTQKIQWEADCKKVRVPWKTLVKWDGDESLKFQDSVNNETNWLYYDYKYMDQILSKEGQEVFKWDVAGFPDRDGSHSTLWIGTQGAYTPFHYDTYGCNLVTQVWGSKTWTLFPPEDTNNLRPTRIPYEESSVYSSINLNCPSSGDLNQLSKCDALEVTLHPGDVLFVPPRWWHFVVHEEFSISVNTWIELPEDNNIRLEEAIMKTLVCGISNLASLSSVSEILNPNESELLELNETDINNMLRSCTQRLQQPPNAVSKRNDIDGLCEKPDPVNEAEKCALISSSRNEPPYKIPKCSGTSGALSVTMSESVLEDLLDNVAFAKKLTPKIFSDDKRIRDIVKDDVLTATDGHTSPIAHVLNAVGHPSVLTEIAKQYLSSVAQNESGISSLK